MRIDTDILIDDRLQIFSRVVPSQLPPPGQCLRSDQRRNDLLRMIPDQLRHVRLLVLPELVKRTDPDACWLCNSGYGGMLHPILLNQREARLQHLYPDLFPLFLRKNSYRHIFSFFVNVFIFHSHNAC